MRRLVTIGVSVLSDQDPWILAQGQTGEMETLESDPSGTAWVLLILGGLLVAAALGQIVIANKDRKNEAKARLYGLEERGSYPHDQY